MNTLYIISLISFLSIFLLSTLGTSLAATQCDLFQCLSSYSQNLTPLIYTQNNSLYQSIFKSSIYNFRALSVPALRPLAIITPIYESQIQVIINCSRLYRIEVRVRSGGHDFEGLSYISKSTFIIIDLRNFRSITIDKENKTLWVQAGANLGELYYGIAQKSRTLAFPAGACPTVGVGGHFSGGGYGMMARKYGLAIDHITDARIVNVNGQILDRESMGEDLFWAIRGGGGASFGVILAWKINLVTVPEIVTVFNVSRTLGQNVTKLVHRWQFISDKLDENLSLRLFIRGVKSSENGEKTIHVSFVSLYIGGVETLLQVMQEGFPELGLVREDCIELSWIESVLYMAGFSTNAPLDILLDRNQIGAIIGKLKSDYVKEPISEKGLLGLWEMLYEVAGTVHELQFSPYGGRINAKSESELPFPHRAGNIYAIEYGVSWNRDDQNGVEAKRFMEWIRRLYDYMGFYVSKSPRAAYLNYRDLDIGVNNIEGSTSFAKASIWGRKYFQSNFERLVYVKTKIDPTNFFRNEQSIPALPSLEQVM